MVSCIVTHHINQNDWLLTRCIRSLIADQCPKEIIIVTDAPFPPTLILAEPCAYLKIFHFTDGSINHSVKKGNFGASKASPSSQAFFFMGDDVVDAQLLRKVGLPAAPITGEPFIKKMVNFVSERPAGYGAFRDLVNFILEAKRIDPLTLKTQ